MSCINSWVSKDHEEKLVNENKVYDYTETGKSKRERCYSIFTLVCCISEKTD